MLWLLGPFLAGGTRPELGSLEHGFVFMPLVAAPLGLTLVSVLLEPERASNASRSRFTWTQPVAATLVFASFCAEQGRLAGALAVPWLMLALAVAAFGLRHVKFTADAQLSNLSLLSAHAFLPVGALFLVLSRFGVVPRNFTALTVMLAALHFHFSGFTLQILVAASGRCHRGRARWRTRLHRCVAVGAVAGIPLIAAGNATAVPSLKFLGVSMMVLSTVGLAIALTAVASDLQGRAARWLLRAAAASIVVSMILAGVYGAFELVGETWLSIPDMAAIHGLLNAVGFTLCGLLGHLCIVRGEAA